MLTRRRALALLIALGCCTSAAAAAEPITGSGFLRSDGKVEVKSKVAVPIRRIPVEEGQVVKGGALLVELANDVQQAAVAQARAEVDRARSAVAQIEVELDIAKRELERLMKVPDLVTEREIAEKRDAVSRAEADLRTRRDEVAKAEAQVKVAQAALDDTMLLAPFDGVVARVYLRPGATPKVAETTILDLLALDRLYVEVALPLQYLRQVRPGMPARVMVEDETRNIALPVSGSVRYIYPEIDSTTRMFRVKVQVDKPDDRVLPGMLARVSVTPAASGR